VGVDVDHEAKVGRQVATDLFPQVTRIVAAHNVPVLLHEEDIRAGGMHCNVMNAVADLGGWFGNVLRVETFVDGLPGVAAVVGPKCARCRDGDIDSLWIFAIQDDCVEAHATGAGLLARRSAWLYPGLAAVIGELNDLPEPAAGLRRIDAIRICGRTLEVIHLPAGKMRSADVALLALAIRCKDKCALARSNQYPYSAHFSLLPINSKAAAGAYLWFRCRKSSLVYITVSVVPKHPS